jgi:hypothetical protein
MSAHRTVSTGAVKCYPGVEGTPTFEFGEEVESRYGHAIAGGVTDGVRSRAGTDKPLIERIHESVVQFISDFNGVPLMSHQAACIPFSDYARSLDCVIKHFAGAAGTVVLARMEAGKVSVTELASC